MKANKENPICVVGMHRSGTSCLTGIMQGFGVELGDVFVSNPFNKRGNREHPRIMALNDEVLAYNGGAWDKPVAVVRWNEEHSQARASILQDLRARAVQRDGYWGFKDPRFLLTYPFWAEVIQPVLIGTFRHPDSVAQSLCFRNAMNREVAHELWYAYNSRLLALLEVSAFPLVDFELPSHAYLDDVLSKLEALGLPVERRDEAAAFFSKDLRHYQASKESVRKLPKKLAVLYAKLQEYAQYTQ